MPKILKIPFAIMVVTKTTGESTSIRKRTYFTSLIAVLTGLRLPHFSGIITPNIIKTSIMAAASTIYIHVLSPLTD